MDTVKVKQSAAFADYAQTAAAVGILLAAYLAWRSFIGHESVAALLGRLF